GAWRPGGGAGVGRDAEGQLRRAFHARSLRLPVSAPFAAARDLEELRLRESGLFRLLARRRGPLGADLLDDTERRPEQRLDPAGLRLQPQPVALGVTKQRAGLAARLREGPLRLAPP